MRQQNPKKFFLGIVLSLMTVIIRGGEEQQHNDAVSKEREVFSESLSEVFFESSSEVFSESPPIRSSGDAEDKVRTQQNNRSQLTECGINFCALIGVCGGLATGLCVAVVYVVVAWRKQKNSTKGHGKKEEEREGLMKEEAPRVIESQAEHEDLKTEVRLLIEEVKRQNTENSRWRKEEERRTKERQEELKTLLSVTTALQDLKTDIENQTKELRQQIEVVEDEMKENRKKLQDVDSLISESERQNALDEEEGHTREKNKLVENKQKLESRKDSLERQQVNIDKMQQAVEDMSNRMKDRQRSLEHFIQLQQ